MSRSSGRSRRKHDARGKRVRPDPAAIAEPTPRPSVRSQASRTSARHEHEEALVGDDEARRKLLREADKPVAEGMSRRLAQDKSVPSDFTDFFPEKRDWAVPGFVPEETPWPRAALDKQEADFQF